MRVCRVCRLEYNSAEEKWFREFHLGRRLFGKRTSRVIQPPEGLTLKDLSIISSRLPLAFNTDRPPAIADVTFTDEGRVVRCTRVGGDRCVVADAPLPTPLQPQLRDGAVIVSPVSYYEVSIRPAEHPRWTNANVKQCVSVGVCLRSWKQRPRGQQAGWCKYSWGLHGDDGNLFHGSGMHHSVEAFSRPFGAGDTIGCGVNYQNNTIFYTLNGQMLGEAFPLHGPPFRRRLIPMIGLDTEWSVKINLGREEFMYHGLPPYSPTTLAKLADYAIAQGWIRTAPPARGDGKIAIRGSILRRLMAATGEGDRAVASTLQPLTSQFSSDGNESESWSDIIEIHDDLFEDEVFTSADPVDDSDFSAAGWVPDFGELNGGVDAFGIEEAGEVPDPGVEDFDEPFVDAVPIDADLDDFELIPNPQWDDLDMVYGEEEVIEDPFMVDQSDSDYYDMVQPFGDGSGMGNGPRALPADSD